MNLKDLTEIFGGLSEANRPIRLRLSMAHQAIEDVLLVKRVSGNETMCGEFEYRLLCVSTRSDLPLKGFKGIFRQTGYEHQSSYKNSAAIASTLYSIVRIAQTATWKC
ncbi:hypothetical protein [Massilia sp. Root335]|jgi:hypothetical protein|uniref:hypothetical protein n=1 Tax=Massilia sp. Root335 TaxID=1736517 RepID=UPI0006F62946|nr:hypothetical protein [Massilia sp. Root335]